MDPLLWGLLLLAAGIVLVVLEFFLPSGGTLAVAACLCILAALIVPFFAEEGAWWRGTIVLFAALVGVPLTLRATVDLWPRSPFGRMLLIELPKGAEDVLPHEALALSKLVGRIGTTKTPMRPSGTIAIDGVYYPAASEGMPIERGAFVKTVAVRMRQLIVVPAREVDLIAAEVAASLPPRVSPKTGEPSPDVVYVSVDPSPADGDHGGLTPSARPGHETSSARLVDDVARSSASEEVLRRNDDLAASIEALDLFAVEEAKSDETRRA